MMEVYVSPAGHMIFTMAEIKKKEAKHDEDVKLEPLFFSAHFRPRLEAVSRSDEVCGV